MGSSLSKGLTEYLPGIAGVPNIQTHHDVYIGYVIDVVKDENSEYYDGPETIGAVLLKRLPAGYNKPENIPQIMAYPLDRGNFTMPLAGEQVWGCIFMGPDTKLRYYYVATVSTDQTAAALVYPFLGSDPEHLRRDGYLTAESAGKRFDKKNGYTATQLRDKVTQEKMREGDKVLEGKFGGVIKFTHTITKSGVWNQNYQIANLDTKGSGILSKDGDPLLIIKSAQRSTTPGFEDDDINADESSMYLATSQNIPLQLNCSRDLRSFEFPDPIILEVDTERELNTSGLAKMFGGGYDPNAKVAIKVEGTLEITPDGSLMNTNPGGASPNPPIADGTVIFVSGLTDSKSHEDQTNDFKSGFGNKYTVVSFKYDESGKIKEFVRANEAKVVALVLFSAACPLAASTTLPSSKVYCIEPWNGDGADAGRGAKYYSGVPAQNMYISGDVYARGKGAKQGANITTKGIGHFAALKESARSIASKI